MNPYLLSGLVLGAAFWGLVEFVYWFDHRPFVRGSYRELADQLDVPEGWLDTLLAIRGLPDGRRGLVFDWQVGDWEER